MSLTQCHNQQNNNEPGQEKFAINNKTDQNYNTTHTNSNLYSTSFYHPKNYTQYHNFLNVSSPVNKTIEQKSYAVYYNKRGLLKDFHPLYSRQDLSKYLKRKGSLLKNNKRYYSNDSKNFDSIPYRTQDNCKFYCRGTSQENPLINNCQFPTIRQPFNDRYGNMRNLKTKGYTPKNKQKISFKLANNNNSTLNSCENIPSHKNINSTDFLKNNGYENCNESNFQTIKNSTNDDNKTSKRDQIINQFNHSNYALRQGRRTFRKAQIFNNYKPFLVDNFRNFADYS